MKVLWIINSILPEMQALINGSVYNKATFSNSWVSAMLEATRGKYDISVAMFYKGKDLIETVINDQKCIAIPYSGDLTKYNDQINVHLNHIKRNLNPDIIHVHGTEYPYVNNILNVFDANKVVISIQGLISIIARYYQAGLNTRDILLNLTLRNIIFCDSVLGQKKEFERRGRYEVLALRKAKHVIGRTFWDKTHTLTFNPELNYHHLDELIRNEFWKSPKWNYNQCCKKTIFVSQCSYPIKGLHKLLEALRIVKDVYPDVKLRIAGKKFLNRSTFMEKLSYSGYAKFINSIIRKYGLETNIEFTGPLNAQRMIDEYLNCNVFVCPSCIENSPNSVCEAQLLGVPSVVSCVGGVYSLTDEGKTVNLYRYEEVEILATYIIRIFKHPELENERTKMAIKLAEQRHSPEKIITGLQEIYENIDRENLW